MEFHDELLRVGCLRKNHPDLYFIMLGGNGRTNLAQDRKVVGSILVSGNGVKSRTFYLYYLM